MWHIVKKMGNLNPHTESKYLFNKMTPMLEKYHAAITDNVYTLMDDATGTRVGGEGKRWSGFRNIEAIAVDAVDAVDAVRTARRGSREPTRPRRDVARHFERGRSVDRWRG
jgi:hypothetical protein